MSKVRLDFACWDLEAIVGYAYEQGLIQNKYDIEDLFDKSSIVMSREVNNYE